MPLVTTTTTTTTSASLRIQKARTTLVLDHPFFGSLLFRLKGRESHVVKTMATDGISLYYNPEFVETLTAATLAVSFRQGCVAAERRLILGRGGAAVSGCELAVD